MKVFVNGKEQSLDGGATVAALVATLELGDKRVAVEVNKELVTKSEWAGAVLKDGDRVEVVTFVGGG